MDKLLLPPHPKSVAGAEAMGWDLRGLGCAAEVEGVGSGVAQALLEAQGSVVVGKLEKADGGFWGGWDGGAGAERLNTEGKVGAVAGVGAGGAVRVAGGEEEEEKSNMSFSALPAAGLD